MRNARARTTAAPQAHPQTRFSAGGSRRAIFAMQHPPARWTLKRRPRFLTGHARTHYPDGYRVVIGAHQHQEAWLKPRINAQHAGVGASRAISPAFFSSGVQSIGYAIIRDPGAAVVIFRVPHIRFRLPSNFPIAGVGDHESAVEVKSYLRR